MLSSGTAGVTTPSFVAHSGKFASTSGQTVDYPAGIQDNDLLMLIIQCDDADTVSRPSGWTHLWKQLGVTGTSEINVYYKFYNGTGSGVYVSDVGDHQIASVLAFRNVSLSNPIHKSSHYATATIDNTPTLNGTITTNDQCYIIYGVFHDAITSAANVSGWPAFSISGGTELIDISTTLGWDGGFACYGGTKETAGNTGSGTVTCPDGNGGFIIALNAGP
jgi:hypothetical protein